MSNVEYEALQWRTLVNELGLDENATAAVVVESFRALSAAMSNLADAVRQDGLPEPGEHPEPPAQEVRPMSQEEWIIQVAAHHWMIVVSAAAQKGWRAISPQVIIDMMPDLRNMHYAPSPRWALPVMH